MGQAHAYTGPRWLLHTHAGAGESGEMSIIKNLCSQCLSPECLDQLPKPGCTTTPEELDAREESDVPAQPDSDVLCPSRVW